jgi:prepilin-type N-terminal cleavage/methylation domain-containing protein
MTRQSERSIVVQDGFSVVEVLIAAALIGLAFLAISTLFPTGYSNITYGGRITTAVAHAQQKIEQLKAIAADTTPGQGFNAIDATNCSITPVILADPLVPSITFTRTCTPTDVSIAALPGDLKKVRVTVTWAAQNRPGSVDQETLFTR